MWVSLSEDATRIINRIQYDYQTNQLLGFVLPTDQSTGLPIPFIYKARNAKEMCSHFCNDPKIAKFVNTVIAQPLGGAPPFCLLIYGTDNRYTTDNVAKRWNYISDQLLKQGVHVLTISSDSDPKLNGAMRMNSGLGLDSTEYSVNGLFKCGTNKNPPYYVQDPPHMLTKLRNLLLTTIDKPNKLLFGKFYIQLKHIEEIVERFGKDKHLLTKDNLYPSDKQNLDSALKICDKKVIDLLKKNVEKSDATVIYLEIMSNVVAAFMNKDMSPIDRIEKMWYSVFVLRMWRKFVEKEPGVTVTHNFMSSLCYYCFEQNAHSFIYAILFLRKNKLENLFLPLLFNSQPCESFFRQLRSFTTTYSTVVNFSVKEVLQRISKIQLQNDISSEKESGFIYPKELKQIDAHIRSKVWDLPDEFEIVNMILKCKLRAIEDMKKLGIFNNKKKNIGSSCICCVPPYMAKKKKNKEKISTIRKSTSSIALRQQLISLSLKNYASKLEGKPINETSHYVEIGNNKKRIVVRKTSLCWFLRKECDKCSSDRRFRVMSSRKAKKNKSKTAKKFKK